MPARILKDYLEARDIPYLLITHSPAYTAQKAAQAAHIRGHRLAKSVIITVDDRLAMVVIPSTHRIDLAELKRSIRAFKLDLACENDFKDLFPGCEPGALPPFGNLYNIDVYVAECLGNEPEITFCAGSRTELMQMAYHDYQNLVDPVVIHFGPVPIGATPPRMKLHGGRFP